MKIIILHDNVDFPINNPFENGSLEHLLYTKNWIDTVQWHLEDIIRDENIDPVEALQLKRTIDASNQKELIWWNILTVIFSKISKYHA